MADELWRERWPAPPAALDVDSYAGTTRIYWWPGTGEPIVFLHGMGGTGLTCSPYVERLAGRDVYAIDTIGDVGRSQQLAVVEDANGLATWLGEALTGADIQRAHVVGTSYGGFIALSLAVHAGGERVSSLTLIDSGGSRRSALAGSCCGASRTCSEAWHQGRYDSCWHGDARCSRTPGSCASRCTRR
jgi:pimeloyl-ACP methyl ester carboxylesterase